MPKYEKEKPEEDDAPVVETPTFKFTIIDGPKELKWTVKDEVSGNEYNVSVKEVMESSLPVALGFGNALVAYSAQ